MDAAQKERLLSFLDGLHTIHGSNEKVGNLLEVDGSTVCKFRNKTTKNSPKIVAGIRKHFPADYAKIIDPAHHTAPNAPPPTHETKKFVEIARANQPGTSASSSLNRIKPQSLWNPQLPRVSPLTIHAPSSILLNDYVQPAPSSIPKYEIVSTNNKAPASTFVQLPPSQSDVASSIPPSIRASVQLIVQASQGPRLPSALPTAVPSTHPSILPVQVRQPVTPILPVKTQQPSALNITVPDLGVSAIAQPSNKASSVLSGPFSIVTSVQNTTATSASVLVPIGNSTAKDPLSPLTSQPTPNSTIQIGGTQTTTARHPINARRFVPTPTPPSAIAIPYREDGGGKGAFFDHQRLQTIAERVTWVIPAPSHNTKLVRDWATSLTYSLTFGDPATGAKMLPPTKEIEEGCNNAGLLFMPGRTRQDEGNLVRQQLEEAMIRNARLRGQPALFVCAASWRLYNAFEGKTVEVRDHCASGMPRLLESGLVGNNMQIHDVIVNPTTLLGKIMKCNNQPVVVNSVHWKAPAPLVPPGLQISAESRANPDKETKNRSGRLMEPDEHTIEAFETCHGAPMLGIQWHPEAYNVGDMAAGPHHRILKWMAKAGDAYAAKCRMIYEFKRSRWNNTL